MMTEFDQKYLDEIKMYFDCALEENDMRYLVYVYTTPKITFYKKLNTDLASRGKLFTRLRQYLRVLNEYCRVSLVIVVFTVDSKKYNVVVIYEESFTTF